MSLAPALRVVQRQRATLAPALRTGLAVLRMSGPELQAEIAREAAENPFLRWRSPPGTAMLPGQLTAEPSLVESLRAQIGLMPLPPDQRAMAEHLAGELREDGYLDSPLAEVAAALDAPLALAEAGLAALQRCEPAGVAARDLAECLALQLADAGLAPGLAAQVVARMEGFVTGAWPVLERELSLPRPALERIAALLPGLAAHPVRPAEAAVALRPDLVLQTGPDGAPGVRLCRETAPRLALDRALLARMADTPFARDAGARATALIAAVEARGRTLVRIGGWLVAAQAAFLAHGPEHLRPLRRREVAEALGLHPSTVGRAVAGKAIDLGGRVLPLSALLAAPLPQAGGPALAGFAVRRRIARLIAAEDPAAPLTDAALRSALAAEGIDIARRTVAKYREWMRLPSSHQRRRLARLRNAVAAPDGGSGAGRRATKAGPTRNRRRHDADPDQRQAD